MKNRKKRTDKHPMRLSVRPLAPVDPAFYGKPDQAFRKILKER